MLYRMLNPKRLRYATLRRLSDSKILALALFQKLRGITTRLLPDRPADALHLVLEVVTGTATTWEIPGTDGVCHARTMDTKVAGIPWKERVYEDSGRLEPVPDLRPVRLRRADRVRAARRGNSRVRVQPRRFAARAGGAGGGCLPRAGYQHRPSRRTEGGVR